MILFTQFKNKITLTLFPLFPTISFQRLNFFWHRYKPKINPHNIFAHLKNKRGYGIEDLNEQNLILAAPVGKKTLSATEILKISFQSINTYSKSTINNFSLSTVDFEPVLAHWDEKTEIYPFIAWYSLKGTNEYQAFKG